MMRGKNHYFLSAQDCVFEFALAEEDEDVFCISLTFGGRGEELPMNLNGSLTK